MLEEETLRNFQNGITNIVIFVVIVGLLLQILIYLVSNNDSIKYNLNITTKEEYKDKLRTKADNLVERRRKWDRIKKEDSKDKNIKNISYDRAKELAEKHKNRCDYPYCFDFKGLQMQAENGDNNIPLSPDIDLYDWACWEARKGMTREEAKTEYVSLAGKYLE